tara:strand:+ start:390 stop:1397 length:1008 start_codon:yes stop_codon:yes gene_type:complete
VSSTIGNLVDRVYREYLEPVDKVESYSYLSSGINDSVDSITYDGNLFSIEEEDALDAGAIVEVGQELMYTTALNATTNTITVKRGQRGTTKAAHLEGALIKIAPAFPRKNVYEAIVDQIKNLYPTLFAVETVEMVASTGYKLLGTYGSNVDTYNYLVTPVKAISQYTDWQSGSDQTGLKYNGVAVEMIDLPNPFVFTDDTSTERTKTYTTGPNVVHAVQFVGISAGHTVFVTFKKKFVTPTNEDTLLSAVGLETEYEPIVMTGTAAQLIAGKDVSKLNTSYITEQIEASVSPIGSSSSISNSLLRYQQLLIQQARSNLRSKYPEPVQLNSILYPT